MDRPISYVQTKGRWYVVYDAQDGRVVHMHEFIAADGDPDSSDGASSPRSEEAAHALRAARQDFDEPELRVMHVPAALDFDAKGRYRVDIASGELKQVAKAFGSPRELARQKRAAKSPNKH